MRISLILPLLGLATIAACSGKSNLTGFDDGGTGGSGSGSGGGSGSGSSGSGGGSGGSSSGGSIGLGSSGSSSGGGSADAGFACAPNPLNYDIPANGCDDDDDGTVDNVTVCDTSLTTGSGAGAALDMLKAMGLCQVSDATHWGVVSASTVITYGHTTTGAGDGNFNYQHGIFNSFGSVAPQEGSALGILSSGTADLYDTKDISQGDSASSAFFKGLKNGMQSTTQGDAPSGYPKAGTNGCKISNVVNDVINLKTTIKVPANAKGFSFDFDFYSGEWPEYVCSEYNDSFIAFLQSTAFNGGTADNISFDTNGNPVGVNIGFFGECSPMNAATGCTILGSKAGTAACAAGATALAGTGFSDPGSYCISSAQTSSGGGATGWLTSTAPVAPGETITLEFMIWDTYDNQYDSSVLLDHFVWAPQEVASTPVTNPSPPPK